MTEEQKEEIKEGAPLPTTQTPGKAEGSGKLPEPVKEEEVKDTLKMLLKEIGELKNDRDILMQSADKRALARYYSRHKEDMPPVVKLRTIGGKLIVGWRMIEDKGSYQIPGTGKWTESQIIEVIYQDGTSEKMQYAEFEHRYEKKITAKRIGIIIDEKPKKQALRLARLDNGEELTIGVEFVN